MHLVLHGLGCRIVGEAIEVDGVEAIGQGSTHVALPAVANHQRVLRLGLRHTEGVVKIASGRLVDARILAQDDSVKAIVEAAPKAIKEAVSKEDAQKFKEKLEAAGAKVELK